jgi:hypothetical protein
VVPVARHRWSLLAFGLAAVTSVALAFAPLITTRSCITPSVGPSACSSSRSSLVAHEGAGVLAVLAVPVLVAALPVIFAGRRMAVASAVALTALMLIGAMSIGVFMVPTVICAWVAATRRPIDAGRT